MSEYVSKARTTKITATSRVAVKIKENFYTVELTEEREIPDVDGIDLEQERSLLFDAVNAEVDAQVDDIIRANTKK